MAKKGRTGASAGDGADALEADNPAAELQDVYILRDDLIRSIGSAKIKGKTAVLEAVIHETGAQLIQYCYEEIFPLVDLVRLVAKTAQKNGLENALERVIDLWGLQEDPDVARLLEEGRGPRGGRKTKTPRDDAGQASGRPADEPGIFQTDSNGKVRPNEANALIAFDQMRVKLSFDAFRREARIEGLPDYGPGLDEDAYSELYLALQRQFFFKIPYEDLKRIIRSAVRRNAFDPIVDYLDGLQWDGVERLDEWLVTYGGAVDNVYVREVGSKFLIAAVRRARDPGCKFDYMPILEGPEKRGKSTAIAILAGLDYFVDIIPVHIADPRFTIERMRGIWIAEDGELEGIIRAGPEQAKAWLSRRADSAALKHERESTTTPRRFVVIGTTNPRSEGILNSTTGNRRFWPVEVSGFELENLARDRDQLWAEAAWRERNGAGLELSTEAEAIAFGEQTARELRDEWSEMIAAYLDANIPFDHDRYTTTIQFIAETVLSLDPVQLTPQAQKRIADSLRRYGLLARVKKVNGRWHWGFKQFIR